MSGFYSRKRKGLPRIYSEWSRHEKRAFSYFEHANDLAEALFDDGVRGYNAICAIKSIFHCSMDQVGWFDCSGYFLDINPPVAIIRLEKFENDVRLFLTRIGVDSGVWFSTDPVARHSNDYSLVPELSEKAQNNLYNWYRQDYEFYRMCEAWIESDCL